MTEPAYTITGMPANTEAALADTLAWLDRMAAEMQPLTLRQRCEKQRLLLCIDRGRHFLPGYVPVLLLPETPVVVEAEEEDDGLAAFARGRTALGRGHQVTR